MTIKEFILSVEIPQKQDRIRRLKEIPAPEVVITLEEEQLKELESGNLSAGGDADLLNTEYVYHRKATGRGGKLYVVFNSCINYFPNARHGRFIKEA